LRLDSSKTEVGVHARYGRISQKIFIPGDDLTIVVAGFNTSKIRFLIYIVLGVITFGMVWLLCRWLPRWYVRLVGSPAPLRSCSWMVIENEWREVVTQSVSSVEYGRSLSTIFGSSDRKYVGVYEEDDDPIVTELRLLDYRYICFCFHSLDDKFVLVKNWTDPNWTDIRAIRSGIDSESRERRVLVFGKNLIDIKEKTTGQLLLDEAFHPFYVFQIASIILWSVDYYYYYAFCIFVISVISITTTLLETKSNMSRLRDVSRFECDVRVLRNGFWRYIASSELVPGDVYEFTDPALCQFPCDSLLLAGDCIVNESMLTGECMFK
jgi:cation-transporting ATPase 13A2